MRKCSKLRPSLSIATAFSLMIAPTIGSTQTSIEAINLAKTIETSVGVQQTTETVDIINAIGEIVSLENGDERDQNIGKIYEDIISVLDQNNLIENADAVITKIAPYKTHDDWFVASHAYIYSSLFHTYKRDYVIALQEANTALELIPNELDPSVAEAKLYATEIIAYLHNLQSNTELAVKTTKELIDLRSEFGLEVNGVSLLNNLMYSFGNWRDHETGKALAEILLRIEENTENTTPGLTDFRVAEVYNELGEYNLALKHAQKTLNTSEIAVLVDGANTQSAIAYAGLGLTDLSIRTLKKLGPRFTREELLSIPVPDGILYAEALIALNQGQGERAIRLMNRRTDVSIQEILARNNTDTTNLLANLENTRERQEERENALRREAQLKAAQLEAQKRINRLLIIVAALLAIATIAASIFARYRDKVSKELAIQTKAAQSADKMKTEFLGMVSHELRTPLNGIIGIADLLTNHHKDEDIRKKTKIILDSGNELTHIVESIIDMSHIDADKFVIYPDTVNPYEEIQDEIEIWRQQAETKGLLFTAFIDKQVDQDIKLDMARFRQCLRNLLSNAVKFTQDGRVHLHMTTELGTDQRLHIKTVIADTGQGITENVQSKLFTPFLQADSTMTRKYGGAGLNLAITRAIARMMDGDVTLISKADRGSEFTFTVQAATLGEDLNEVQDATAETESTPLKTNTKAIPDLTATIDLEADSSETGLLENIESNTELVDENGNILTLTDTYVEPETDSDTDIASDDLIKDKVESSEPTYKESLEGLKVLIVEDMATNRDIIRLFLDPAGCICKEAENGQEALEMLQEDRYDVILIDIRMPVMDGIETTKIIRKTDNPHKDTPIIALTADSTSEVNAECLSVGMDIFLAKPVISADLTESILFLLKQRQQSSLRNLAVA